MYKYLIPFLYKFPNSYFPFVLELILKFTPNIKHKGKGILIINTHDRSGGAAKIAFQLASSMKDRQAVSMLVKYKDRSETWIHRLGSNEETLSPTLSNYLNDQEKKGGWLDFSKIGLISYSKDTFFKESNIIHFHNLHGGYFSYALLPYLSKQKKLIWTLHDEHAITGHCSFTMKCEGWKEGCSSCKFLSVYPAIQKDNAKHLKKFKERWINQSTITFVTPSYWLSKRLKEVYPFVDNIQVIPNGIDTSIFKPLDKNESRRKFNLPEDKFLVLFIAEYATNNPFKGGETIRELIRLNTNPSITFITIGGESQEADATFMELPYIKEEKELVTLYSACDLMLYPTNADNHPLVVMEAMACQLPVLAPKIGGIPEIIDTDENGWLVEEYSNSEVYLNRLHEIYQLKQTDQTFFHSFGLNARNKIHADFNKEQMVSNYDQLYANI